MMTMSQFFPFRFFLPSTSFSSAIDAQITTSSSLCVCVCVCMLFPLIQRLRTSRYQLVKMQQQPSATGAMNLKVRGERERRDCGLTREREATLYASAALMHKRRQSRTSWPRVDAVSFFSPIRVASTSRRRRRPYTYVDTAALL